MNKYLRKYIKKEETTKPKLSLSELVELYENNEIGLKTIKETLDENMKSEVKNLVESDSSKSKTIEQILELYQQDYLTFNQVKEEFEQDLNSMDFKELIEIMANPKNQTNIFIREYFNYKDSDKLFDKVDEKAKSYVNDILTTELKTSNEDLKIVLESFINESNPTFFQRYEFLTEIYDDFKEFGITKDILSIKSTDNEYHKMRENVIINDYFLKIKSALEVVRPATDIRISENMNRNQIDDILKSNEDSLLFDKVKNVIRSRENQAKKINEQKLKIEKTTEPEPNKLIKNDRKDLEIYEKIFQTVSRYENILKEIFFTNHKEANQILDEQFSQIDEYVKKIKKYDFLVEIFIEKMRENTLFSLPSALLFAESIESQQYFKSLRDAIENKIKNEKKQPKMKYLKDVKDSELIQIDDFKYLVKPSEDGKTIYYHPVITGHKDVE